MILPKSIEYMFKYSINNTFFKYIHAAVFIVLFIWFLELKGGYIYKIGSNRKKDIKIKAKAKPNRLKNMKQQKSHNV